MKQKDAEKKNEAKKNEKMTTKVAMQRKMNIEALI